MSEFSLSMHYRDAKVADLVAQARREQARVIVLPEGERWTCVVGEPLGPSEGVCVQFSNAPDHECSARLFEGTKKTGAIRIFFEGQKPRPFDPAPWLRLGLLDEAGARQVARWIERGEPGSPARGVGQRLAELLGFRHYKWLSPSDIAERWNDILARDPGAVGVDPSGRLPSAAEPEPPVRVPRRSAGPTLAELLVEERFVILAPGSDPHDLDEGVQVILRTHPEAAARAKELVRWLRAQKRVRRVEVDAAVLEGMLEAF